MNQSTGRTLATQLADGPPRGLGCAAAVASTVSSRPALMRELVEALQDERPVVVTRAAHALKHVQAAHPALLQPFLSTLVHAAPRCRILAARWNLTIVLGNANLRGQNRALVVDLMFRQIEERSALLRTFALQALFQLLRCDVRGIGRLHALLEQAKQDPSAAMRARARLLKSALEQQPPVRAPSRVFAA